MFRERVSFKNSSKWVLGEDFNFFIAPGVILFTQYWTELEMRLTMINFAHKLLQSKNVTKASNNLALGQ